MEMTGINSHLKDSEWERAFDAESKEEGFLRALSGAYRDIYASALSIVGGKTDVEDVIQDVCIVLWQRYDEFEQGTNFRRWACTITFNVAKAAMRKKRGRTLSEDAMQRIVKLRSSGEELFELRREVLRKCISKLPPSSQLFLMDCYSVETSLADYAKATKTPIASLYTKLKRLRRRLSQCVQESFAKDL